LFFFLFLNNLTYPFRFLFKRTFKTQHYSIIFLIAAIPGLGNCVWYMNVSVNSLKEKCKSPAHFWTLQSGNLRSIEHTEFKNKLHQFCAQDTIFSIHIYIYITCIQRKSLFIFFFNIRNGKNIKLRLHRQEEGGMERVSYR
jgi:hypothetical protein